MADDYELTHKFIYLLKNKSAGSVPNLNYVQNRSSSYNRFDKPKSGSWENNRNSYRPKIKRGNYLNQYQLVPIVRKRDTLFQNVGLLKGKMRIKRMAL
jgi:hypothetical protein